MSFTVSISEESLRLIETEFRNAPTRYRTIMYRAFNRTASTVRTRATRGIASEIRMKQKDIRANIAIRKANRHHLAAVVTIRGRRIPLIRFGPRELKSGGISYKIAKKGGRERIRDAFIATMKSGHVGAFKRRGKSRLPIIELRGPSIVGVYERHLQDEISRESGEVLEKNILQNFKHQRRLTLSKMVVADG